MPKTQGKNIRFQLSKPLEQCVEVLHKHSLHNRENALGISISNLESASHQASAAVSWGDNGMVRTGGKVILIPENEMSTTVQVEIYVKAYREQYVKRNIFSAIIFILIMLFIPQNVPLWISVMIILAGFGAIMIIYELIISFQRRSRLNNINEYVASVTFDLFGVYYNPEMTKQIVMKKKKRA
jgi:hypothetical protein